MTSDILSLMQNTPMSSTKTENGPKDVLKVDNFKGKFSPKDFIETLSSKLLESTKVNEFDPKPFIRNFESVTEVYYLI